MKTNGDPPPSGEPLGKEQINESHHNPFGFASTALDAVAGLDLSDRRAVVIGAPSGLGVETARALAAPGRDPSPIGALR